MKRIGKRNAYRRITVAIMIALCAIGISGCIQKKEPLEKIRDLEFTVIAEENIPQELLQTIEEKKQQGFKVTFQDNGFQYICTGYGEQTAGGYSIAVNGLYETENAVYMDTTLLGPKPEETEGKKTSPSFPYIVIKTEFIDKPVVFE